MHPILVHDESKLVQKSYKGVSHFIENVDFKGTGHLFFKRSTLHSKLVSEMVLSESANFVSLIMLFTEWQSFEIGQSLNYPPPFLLNKEYFLENRLLHHAFVYFTVSYFNEFRFCVTVLH